MIFKSHLYLVSNLYFKPELATNWISITLIEARPFLAGCKEIPRLPHLILVPGTLISQWLDELYTLYAPGSVDVFVYPSSVQEQELFWAPDGPFYSSRHEMSNRIILAPHSVRSSLTFLLFHTELCLCAGLTQGIWLTPLDEVQETRFSPMGSSTFATAGAPRRCLQDVIWPKFPLSNPRRGS